MSETGVGPPAEEQLLSVSRQERDGAVVVTAAGEVDLMTAPRLRVAIEEALLATGVRLVVVDLRQVTFLDSAGLHALAASTDQAGQHGQLLRIVVGEHRAVRRAIEVSGLDQLFALRHSVEEALRR